MCNHTHERHYAISIYANHIKYIKTSELKNRPTIYNNYHFTHTYIEVYYKNYIQLYFICLILGFAVEDFVWITIVKFIIRYYSHLSIAL